MTSSMEIGDGSRETSRAELVWSTDRTKPKGAETKRLPFTRIIYVHTLPTRVRHHSRMFKRHSNMHAFSIAPLGEESTRIHYK